jgi:hypothetical protein
MLRCKLTYDKNGKSQKKHVAFLQFTQFCFVHIFHRKERKYTRGRGTRWDNIKSILTSIQFSLAVFESARRTWTPLRSHSTGHADSNMNEGCVRLKDLTKHFTTRTDDSHATPVSNDSICNCKQFRCNRFQKAIN